MSSLQMGQVCHSKVSVTALACVATMMQLDGGEGKASLPSE